MDFVHTCIMRGKSYFWAEIAAKMVTFSLRIYSKFLNFVGVYFPHCTTPHCTSTNLWILFLAVVKYFVLLTQTEVYSVLYKLSIFGFHKQFSKYAMRNQLRSRRHFVYRFIFIGAYSIYLFGPFCGYSISCIFHDWVKLSVSRCQRNNASEWLLYNHFQNVSIIWKATSDHEGCEEVNEIPPAQLKQLHKNFPSVKIYPIITVYVLYWPIYQCSFLYRYCYSLCRQLFKLFSFCMIKINSKRGQLCADFYN